MAFPFRRARVLVTGASSGIGAAVAQLLASKGALLALSARREALLHEVAQRCRAAGGEAMVLPADLGDTRAAQRLAQDALTALGGIDVLVNCAGVPRRVHARRLTYEDVEETMRVNYLGTMALTLGVVGAMLEQGTGHVVMVGSIAGRLPAPREGAYAASKHALAAMTECLAIDLRGTGVGVHLVTPAVVDTPLWDVPGQERGAQVASVPARDVARAVVRVLDRDRFEAVVPRRFRATTALKPLLGSVFLSGAARFDRRRVPEAHEE